ncbi:hypothetical protein [Thalassotalea marina]|uniref:Tetratricopeptide repeat protein n=1 Tax=Thalassotalea marina TaxID=1673741 RepID=A0A919BGN7_9GAMM|nr:hypothetical protein [Thalassotalea marina]GHF87967.1 hypothetical protein GCM10017161_14540 [Thalassotalea marina]
MKNKAASYLLTLIITWPFGFSTALYANTQTNTHASAKEQLQQAIVNRKSGNFSHAIGLLTPLRAIYVNHKRINIELTLNYIKLRQFDRAEQLVLHLESLPLSTTEQSVVAKLKQVLSAQLKRSLTTHSFTVNAVSAVGLDIMQNKYPVYIFDDTAQEAEFWSLDEELDDVWFSSEFVYVDDGLDEQFDVRDQDTERTEVSYFSQALEANYRYRPAQFLTLFEQPTQLVFDVDAELKYKQFDRKDNDRYLSYNLDSSIYLLQIDRWLLEFNTMARLDYANNEKLVNKMRYRLAFSLPFSSSKLKFAYDVTQKYYRNTLSDYNATIHAPWIEYTYIFSPEIRLQIGSKFHRLNAQDNFLSYQNKQAYLALYYFPSPDLVFYSSYNHYKLHYEIDDPEIVNWSNETKRSLSLGIKYQYNSKVSFSLSGNIGDNRIENMMGEDNWQRIEASFDYRF